MKLKRIKISGFKSFADPVTLHVPGTLYGIVGPNGSGKSNVIDAVRWVVGESSAKSLRSESLEDVIFNGSSDRRPASRASVELLFDNSFGRAPGQWSRYAEISIRRSLTRDGASAYYINNSHIRRKDVRELFLGTGFGPRSYSIIEQGMISRIVESKPEELSTFVEEASGVSRFREKRQETFRKLRRTRENLERLDDMRAEVEQRLRQLKYQSDQARRYTQLKEAARTLRLQILSLQWLQIHQQKQHLETKISELDVEKQKSISNVRSIELDLENQRKFQINLQGDLNDLQMKQYRINAEIDNLDRQIDDAVRVKQEQQSRLSQLKSDGIEIKNSISKLAQQKSDANDKSLTLQQKIQCSAKQLVERQQAIREMEERLESTHNELETCNAKVLKAVQARTETLSKLEQVRRNMESATNSIRAKKLELQQLSAQADSDEVNGIQSKIQFVADERDALQNKIDLFDQKLTQIRAQSDQYREEQESYRDQAQEAQIQLKTLQGKLTEAVRNTSEMITDWLGDTVLADAPALSSLMQVEEGWERAVDRVLGDKLSAVYVEDVEKIASSITKPVPSKVIFVEGNQDSGGELEGSGSLADFVESKDQIAEKMLADTFIAESLSQAMARRFSLKVGECIVTAEGAVVGGNWYAPVVQEEVPSGVLEASALVKKFSLKTEEINQRLKARRNWLRANKKEIISLVDQIGEAKIDLRKKNANLVGMQARLTKKLSDEVRSAERLSQTEESIGHLIELIQELETKEEQLQRQLTEHRRVSNETETGKNEVAVRFRRLTQEVKHGQSALNEKLVAHHQLELEFELQKSKGVSCDSSISDLNKRLEDVRTERELLLKKQNQTVDPTAAHKAKITALIEQRKECDFGLSVARSKMDESESDFRKQDRRRITAQIAVEEQNQSLQNKTVELTQLSARLDEISRKMEELGSRCEDEIAVIDTGFNLETQMAKLTSIERRIDQTGPVNLVAVEQYDQERQRKEYMDRQHEDLSKAVSTLKATITKIDRESRQQYVEMFNLVNSTFQRLLPTLFGGGSGHIELIGEYPENAGLRVFARPKGKRIHNIQALSGGEKALTAVALLLTFFQLNPSPVCLLDEVDAPLDDENVYRLCECLKDISEFTQMLLITHNKITMESVDSLIGVTMAEPNVSKMLSVDLQQAQKFAA